MRAGKGANATASGEIEAAFDHFGGRINLQLSRRSDEAASRAGRAGGKPMTPWDVERDAEMQELQREFAAFREHTLGHVAQVEARFKRKARVLGFTSAGGLVAASLIVALGQVATPVATSGPAKAASTIPDSSPGPAPASVPLPSASAPAAVAMPTPVMPVVPTAATPAPVAHVQVSTAAATAAAPAAMALPSFGRPASGAQPAPAASLAAPKETERLFTLEEAAPSAEARASVPAHSPSTVRAAAPVSVAPTPMKPAAAVPPPAGPTTSASSPAPAPSRNTPPALPPRTTPSGATSANAPQQKTMQLVAPTQSAKNVTATATHAVPPSAIPAGARLPDPGRQPAGEQVRTAPPASPVVRAKYGQSGVLALTGSGVVIFDREQRSQRLVPIGAPLPDGSVIRAVDVKSNRVSTDRGDIVFD